MSPNNYMTNQTRYTVDWTYNQPITSAATWTPATITSPLPARAKRSRWVPKWIRELGLRALSERGGSMEGSSSTKTTKAVTSKKKITLERKEGVPRDKGSGIEEIHRGSVELVRTVEGTANQIESIGLKVSPRDSSSFVEIPIDDLLAAIEDLRDTHVTDIADQS